jgi:ketosteroid isomerase-like protein
MSAVSSIGEMDYKGVASRRQEREFENPSATRVILCDMSMMMASSPIQTPVTGREYSGGQREPMQALAQFYRALNERDIDMMQRNWINSSDAAMDNPLGGIKRGWSEISKTYEALFRSPGAYWFEFYDYSLHQSGDLFYVVGRERGELTVNRQPMTLAISTSRVFRRDEEGNWRQTHHHGSIDEPQMLAAYQQAVLGAISNTSSLTSAAR